jgi:hypothetical protein
MRDLYRGLILLATDAAFRKEITDKAEMRFDSRIPACSNLPDLRRQPDLDALRAINTSFRAKGLFLCAYALAEINRWLIDGGVKFQQALEQLGSELAGVLPAGSSSGVHEAAGAIVSDPRLLLDFRSGRSLIEDGFDLTQQQEAQLRAKFAAGSNATKAASDIFRLGWTTSTCGSAFLVYDGMFHTNM